MSPEVAPAFNNTPQPFVDGSQVDTAPQLTQAETEKGGMVGPGQEGILDEFIKEQEQERDEEAILGKFKSPQELAKAYAELQRKMGEQSSRQPDSSPAVEPDSAPAEGNGYTRDQAAEFYGKEAVDALAAKGVDLADVMFKADQGQDISGFYDSLSEAFNVPRNVVEQYVQKAQAGDLEPAQVLTEQDAATLLEPFGGRDGFNELSAWARDNLDQGQLDSYNAVVDSGNKEAISWALQAMQAMRGAPNAVVEPKLYGGGTPSDNVVRFESQQQVLDAMNKRNDRGQRYYDVDEAYRNKVQMILQNSDVF